MLRKAAALPSGTRRLLAGLAFRACIVKAGLRFLPFDAFWSWLRRRPASSPGGDPAELLLWEGTFFRRFPLRLSCLERALTLYWALRSLAQPAELKVGLSKRGRSLEAHAWVESGARVLGDVPDVASRYPEALTLTGAR